MKIEDSLIDKEYQRLTDEGIISTLESAHAFKLGVDFIRKHYEGDKPNETIVEMMESISDIQTEDFGLGEPGKVHVVDGFMILLQSEWGCYIGTIIYQNKVLEITGSYKNEEYVLKECKKRIERIINEHYENEDSLPF